MVVGGASLDVLHLGGETVRSAGGAGLYTSLAARRAGARVTMVAPRPEPVPPELAPALERIEWLGPRVLPGELPRFEIAHYGGGRTEYRSAQARAEASLAPGLVAGLELRGDLVYLIPMLDPDAQLELLRHLRGRGWRVACGTCAGAVEKRPPTVLRIAAEADAFFCNEREAVELFGSLDAARTAPGRLLLVTRGARGARVVQGDWASDVPAVAVVERDPTGAGDTFCGTALALLAAGTHPVPAARAGVAAAAEMVTAVGPEALLRPPPPASAPEDRRVRVDPDRLRALAGLLAELPEVAPFDFTGGPLPEVGDPRALDFFFAATLQQFGFWEERAGRWGAPMIAALGGRRLKGSDYLWAAYRRWLETAPEELEPAGQALIGEAQLAQRLADDGGACPMPALELHAAQARSYGRDALALGWTPRSMVGRANASPGPLAALLGQLDHLGGYKEDPLRKKSVLLGLILQQRPEAFLRRRADEPVPPVVDYHVQRTCLRTGLVAVEDEALRRRLVEREVLAPDDEQAVREACHRAMIGLCAASGRSMGAVDWFFFQSRSRCPETSEPECARCPADPACAHDTALFQPVLRTPFY